MKKNSYNVVSKGICSYPQTENFVSAKQFLIINDSNDGEGDKRYLLVKLTNNHKENVTAALLKIEQFTERGDKIASDDVYVDGFCGYPRKSFAVEKKIPVAPTCADCRITVIEAEFGNYVYRAEDMGDLPIYRVRDNSAAANAVPSKEFKKVGKSGVRVEPRSLKMTVLVFLVAIAVIISAFIGIYIYINTVTAPLNSFLHDGVYYTFIDNDRSDGSDIYVSGYRGTQSKIEIPAQIEGHNVVNVGSDAFKGNKNIVSVSFGGDIIIGSGAFNNCKNLKTVNLQNATSIGADAFRGCSKLSDVSLNKATTVGEYAFSGCAELKSLAIDDSAESINLGRGAFSSCTKLQTIDINREIDFTVNASAAVFSGCKAIRELHLSTFTCGKNSDYTVSMLFDGAPSLSTLVIDSIDRVGVSLCDGLSVKTVRFNEIAVPEIGARAFYNCTDLQEVFIPTPVTYVGDEAFYNTAITKFDGSDLEWIGDSAFCGCNALSTVTLVENDKLKHIGDEAFKDSSVKSIDIPSSITAIGDGVFTGCASLATVVFAEDCTLREIPQDTFSGCTKLSSVNIPNGVRTIGSRAFESCSALAKCELPDGITTLGVNAFAGSGLMSMELPLTVTTVNRGAFSGCDSLVSITLPYVGRTRTNNTYLSYIFGAEMYSDVGVVPASLACVTITDETEAANNAFNNCEYITEVVYEQGLSYVGSNSFRGCASLLAIDFGTEIESIGDYAFYGCSSITEIVLPNSVTELGQSAFGGCTSLKSLKTPFVGGARNDAGGLEYMFVSYDISASSIPASLAKVEITDSPTIYSNAFWGSSVREVVLGPATTYIQTGAFTDNRKLNVITLPQSLELISDYAFYGCNLLYEVYNYSDLDITVGSMANGYVAYYALKVHTVDEPRLPFVEYDGYGFVENEDIWHLVQYDESLTDISLPTAVETDDYSFTRYGIRDRLFMNNELIESILVPSNITEIGDSAFYGCRNLTTATVMNGVLGIEENAFGDCYSLTSFVFPNSVGTVSDSVLYGCSLLNELVLPNSIDKVGSAAFYGCSSLQSVVIPDDCASIGDMAFCGCTLLCSVNIPSSCTQIGESAFGDCRRIKTVTLPETLERIGERAFFGCLKLYEVYDLSEINVVKGTYGNGCVAYYAYAVYDNRSATPLDNVILDGLHYYKLDGEWYLVDYYGESGELNVSGFMYDGEIVDSINIINHAFQYYTSVKSLTANESLEYIGEYAFDSCTNLEAVDISTAELTIDMSAFSYCNALTTLAVRAGAAGNVTIYSNAFINSALTSIALNGGSYFIYEMAFAQCFYIENFTAQCNRIDIYDNVFYNSEAADALINAEIICTTANIHDYAFRESHIGSFVLNASEAAQIGEYIFSGYDLTEVEISGGSISVGQYLFNGSFYINNITISGTQISLSSYAFNGITAESMSISGSASSPLSFLGNAFNSVTIGNLNLSGDISLAASAISYSTINTLTINDNNGSLNIANILYSCTVSNLVISGDEVKIEDSAFKWQYYGDYNSNVSTLDISAANSLTVGVEAFYNQNELASVVLVSDKASSIGDSAFYGCYNVSTLTLPKSLTSIKRYAFSGCNSLIELAIPSGVTTIGNSAFYGCSSLTKLELPSNLTTIEGSAFSGCGWLYSLVIPSSVTAIGNSAFYGCSSLTKLELASNLTAIESYAFYNCASLKELTIPNSVTAIGNGAFYGCGSLVKLALSNNLTTIESTVFTGCNSLIELTIPSGVTAIGGSAFYGCNNLTKLNLPNNLTTIEGFAFYYCNSLAELTIPRGVTAIGTGAFYGCSSFTALELPSSLTTLESYAFSGCINLTALTLPNGLTEISDYAFYNCYSLTELTIPSSVTSIGNSAFYGCSSLKKLSLPDNITSIGGYAFYECNSLEALALPDKLTSIESYAFNGCNSLAELKLPARLTAINDGAFYGCSSLVKLSLPTGLQYIGARAFYDCRSFTELKLPNGLQSVENQAFSGALNLRYVELPESLSYIGSDAFYGDTQLFSVYNRSSYLNNIVAGTYDHGCVALYAVIVTNDPQKAVVSYAESGDYKFARADGVWYLYATNGDLPTTVTTALGVINEYVIKSFTFEYYVNSIMIPRSVKRIQARAFAYGVVSVFYEGTEEKWQQITQDAAFYPYYVYYYVDCVHHDYEWTLTGGNIRTEKSELGEWTVVKEPTCDKAGSRQRRCVNSDCDYCEEEEIPPLGHDIGADGKCKVCGKVVSDNNRSIGETASYRITAYCAKTKYDKIWGLV